MTMTVQKDTITADITVIGGGVAGLATAYWLARGSDKKILVLEQDRALGLHASGRNAGMIRQAIAEPLIARLALEGRKTLERFSKGRWKNISYRANGSLLLAREDKTTEINKIRKITAGLGIRTLWLTHRQASQKVPLLAQADFKKALFCPSDASLDIQAVLMNFYRELKNMGATVLFGALPIKITREDGAFCVDLGSKRILTHKIVNAAGAWCGLLAKDMGAQNIPLRPYRRHLYSTHPVTLNQERWPFVWDLSLDFYFRPEGRGLLLSACDKSAVSGRPLAARIERIDPAVKKTLFKKMRLFTPGFPPIKIKNEKSGLRTMSPDGRFVIGEDAKIPGFYWVAGLGGHGMTTCFATGKLCSDIILGKKTNAVLKKAFNPGRFLK